MDKELLRDLNGLVERAQGILREHVKPGSPLTEQEALRALVGVLDGPEQRQIQAKVRQALRDAAFSFLGEGVKGH